MELIDARSFRLTSIGDPGHIAVSLRGEYRTKRAHGKPPKWRVSHTQ